jgi:hypothetical protein
MISQYENLAEAVDRLVVLVDSEPVKGKVSTAEPPSGLGHLISVSKYWRTTDIVHAQS